MPRYSRSPSQDLAEAIGTLERINSIHARSSLASAHIDQVESILYQALNPDTIYQYDPKTARPRDD